MLFRKKSKEEKVLEDIKNKKAQIDKLKEEIVTMGKLVLRDGKLEAVKDKPAVQAAPEQQGQAPMMQMPQVPPPPVMEEFVAPQANTYPPELMQQYQQQQSYPPPQSRGWDIPQQPRQAQPQYQQPRPQYAAPVALPVAVKIEMITGTVIVLEVAREQLQSFIEEINAAIDNQASLPLNNRVINGRNVVVYSFE